MSPTKIISIGPLSFTFTFSDPAWDRLINDNYGHFLSHKHTDIPITIFTQPSITRDKLRVAVTNRSVEIRREDFSSLTDARFAHTELTITRNKYSLNSWLRIFLTIAGIRQNVVLIHGAGYHDGHAAYLFPGRSGAGKSTITRLLGKQNALSDELTLLHVEKSRVVAYSTPFWGELTRGGDRALNGKLSGIFSLRHGTGVSAVSSDFPSILRLLLTTALFFTDAPRLMARLLRLSKTIAQNVPGFTLTFSKKATRIKLLNTIRAHV